MIVQTSLPYVKTGLAEVLRVKSGIF